MNEYVTVAIVDDLLGTGWQGDADAEQAVREANVWLTAKRLPLGDPVDGDIQLAGAYLAREAASDRLYADRAPALKRKRVKADTVESETEYQDGATRSAGAMRLVTDLLRPWLGGGSTFAVRRA